MEFASHEHVPDEGEPRVPDFSASAEIQDNAAQPVQQTHDAGSFSWRALENRAPSVKATKWGRCAKCGYAQAPHVFESGRRSGQAVLLCSRFWKRGVAGERLCWNSVPATSAQLRLFPEYLKEVRRSLWACFQRGRC